MKRWPYDPDEPHVNDWRCVCSECRHRRAARQAKSARADRRHSDRHMVDPDYLRDRKR